MVIRDCQHNEQIKHKHNNLQKVLKKGPKYLKKTQCSWQHEI
jgi:hypothetical protein